MFKQEKRKPTPELKYYYSIIPVGVAITLFVSHGLSLHALLGSLCVAFAFAAIYAEQYLPNSLLALFVVLFLACLVLLFIF